MHVEKASAMSLGITEREGGIDKDGKPYSGYTRLNYVVVGESESRKFYPETDKMKADVRSFASRWGSKILLTGEVDSKGGFDITEIHSGNGGNNAV